MSRPLVPRPGDATIARTAHNVLVVDDDALVRAVIARILTDAGCSVRTEGDGLAALSALEDEPFSLLITDWEMPRMSGVDLCSTVRHQTNSDYAHMQILVLTARTGQEAVTDALDAGADDFVSKPFRPRELLARVRAALRVASLKSRLQQTGLEQVALRRVAVAVARSPEAEEIFDVVAQEVAALLGVEVGAVYRFDADTATPQGWWSVGSHRSRAALRLDGTGALSRVYRTEAPAHIADYASLGDDVVAGLARTAALRASVAAPVRVGGACWGAVLAASRREGALDPDAARRLADFAEILALAIANDEARSQRDRLSRELQQAHRLEAVGLLAAGVAHEINTPMQFIGDSIAFLQDALDDIWTLVARYRAVAETARGGQVPPEMLVELAEAEAEVEVDYLNAQTPGAIARTRDGISRVTRIVRAMKDFAHPQLEEHAPSDLATTIASALSMAAHRAKGVATVTTDIPDLPLVTCDAGDIARVILNLLINAVDAIQDKVADTGEMGTIHVAARAGDGAVTITVADDGTGIPEHQRARIFDPFFTTKEVGRGTGQGLALAWATVVEQHGGSLTWDTEIGRGTTFSVRLPIAPGPTVRAGGGA